LHQRGRAAESVDFGFARASDSGESRSNLLDVNVAVSECALDGRVEEAAAAAGTLCQLCNVGKEAEQQPATHSHSHPNPSPYPYPGPRSGKRTSTRRRSWGTTHGGIGGKKAKAMKQMYHKNC